MLIREEIFIYLLCMFDIFMVIFVQVFYRFLHVKRSDIPLCFGGRSLPLCYRVIVGVFSPLLVNYLLFTMTEVTYQTYLPYLES